MLRLIRNTFYFLIILGIFGCVLLFMYAMKLEKEYHLDDRKLGGALWSMPARVYARPLELYKGATLTPEDLINELKLLDYREVASPNNIKQYHREGNTVEYYAQPFNFWDGQRPARRMQVQFDKNKVSSVQNLSTLEEEVLERLEPLHIASIYPASKQDRVLVNLEDVPPVLVDSLIAVEDKNFWRHPGIDPRGLARSIYVTYIQKSGKQGASTLTQQFIKNHYLSNEQTLSRKLKEMLMALVIEYHNDKKTILEGYLKALDALDEVIALIRRSPTVDEARAGLIDLLDVDAIQADAILALQLRRLAALERQKIMDEHAELKARVDDLNDILAKPERQRAIISTELSEIVDKFGDERRTRILPFDGEMSMEDLIPEEDVVVTITRDGFAKRTRTDNYRSQKRGGKGVRGTQLRGDDVVEHFFVTTTHNWLLFFTNLGRVYRAKAYEIPEGGRDAKGQHVANLLAFQPDEHIAQVLAIRTYEDADYLVLATKRGLVKKTPLSLYNSPRSGGIIAINLREDEDGKPDELVSAQTIMADEDLILVSRDGQAVRFTATDDQLRSMGRSTSGVRGMKFRGDDELLSMEVPRENTDLLIVTESGYAKRTPVEEYPTKSRGTLGVRVGKLVDERGGLVGALVVRPDEDVMVITESGKLVQVNASDVRPTARNTMGVIFARPDDGDRIIAITRNSDSGDEDETDDSENTEAVEGTDTPADEASAPAGGDETAATDN